MTKTWKHEINIITFSVYKLLPQWDLSVYQIGAALFISPWNLDLAMPSFVVCNQIKFESLIELRESENSRCWCCHEHNRMKLDPPEQFGTKCEWLKCNCIINGPSSPQLHIIGNYSFEIKIKNLNSVECKSFISPHQMTCLVDFLR